MQVQIRYLDHSGFRVDTEQFILVFDWYSDPAAVMQGSFEDQRPLFFFTSHSHYDHWNDEILTYPHGGPVYYYLDSSCEERVRASRVTLTPNRQIIYIQPQKCYELTGLGDETAQLMTFPSTDEGVAFLLQCGELSIYHAGDLNCWDWQDENSEAVRYAYTQILSQIKASLPGKAEAEPTLAFVPLDARLGDMAYDGCLLFLQQMHPRFLVPMHLNGGERLPSQLEARLAGDPAQRGTMLLAMIEPGEPAVFEL